MGALAYGLRLRRDAHSDWQHHQNERRRRSGRALSPSLPPRWRIRLDATAHSMGGLQEGGLGARMQNRGDFVRVDKSKEFAGFQFDRFSVAAPGEAEHFQWGGVPHGLDTAQLLED